MTDMGLDKFKFKISYTTDFPHDKEARILHFFSSFHFFDLPIRLLSCMFHLRVRFDNSILLPVHKVVHSKLLGVKLTRNRCTSRGGVHSLPHAMRGSDDTSRMQLFALYGCPGCIPKNWRHSQNRRNIVGREFRRMRSCSSRVKCISPRSRVIRYDL